MLMQSRASPSKPNANLNQTLRNVGLEAKACIKDQDLIDRQDAHANGLIRVPNCVVHELGLILENCSRSIPLAMSENQVYVSITGLRLKRIWHLARFWRHALASMYQATQSDGNLLAEARTIRGVHHTLTVWEDETAMRRFLYRGAHRDAIKAFPDFAYGKTFGFVTDEPPRWDQVHELWLKHGEDY